MRTRSGLSSAGSFRFGCLFALAAILFSCVLHLPGHAGTRALLVGVSDYDDGIGLADLRGPPNDITLLRDVLAARGVDDMTILAHAVEGGKEPTRAAILSAFDALAARSGPGDLVYVHLSGHGTRQHDCNGDETDGLDEVFLPSDTARAEPGSGTIPNAIVDDEIGAAVAAIRATGADVWFVLDSCHAGSATRAASPGVAARFVDPVLLGIDLGGKRVLDAAAIESPPLAGGGGFLAFYSARSSELAHEIAIPGDNGEERWYGLFTAKLAARLQDGAAMTYRQLFQSVLADLNDSHVPGAARLQTPLWEGTMIDAAVFGGASTAGLRRFAIEGAEIKAGKLHGIAEGSLLALVGDAADPADAVIAHAQAFSVKATSARLRPVAADCEASADTPCVQTGTIPATARFAQVVSHPLDMTVAIAPLRSLADGRILASDHPAAAALSEALGKAGAQMHIATGGAAYDIETGFDGERIWFGRTALVGTQPAGLAVPVDAAALAAALDRIAGAERLARLLDSVGGNRSPLSPSPVRISANLSPADARALQPADGLLDPREECRDAHAATEAQPQAMNRRSELKQCDIISIEAKGETGGERDLNRIHIDAKFCIHVRHAPIVDAARPMAVGNAMVMCSDCPDGYSAGAERLYVAVTESPLNAEPVNLEGLFENCGPQGEAASRSAGTSRLLSFLEEKAKRPATRGSFGFGVSDVWVDAFEWVVLPRDEALAREGG